MAPEDDPIVRGFALLSLAEALRRVDAAARSDAPTPGRAAATRRTFDPVSGHYTRDERFVVMFAVGCCCVGAVAILMVAGAALYALLHP